MPFNSITSFKYPALRSQGYQSTRDWAGLPTDQGLGLFKQGSPEAKTLNHRSTRTTSKDQPGIGLVQYTYYANFGLTRTRSSATTRIATLHRVAKYTILG